MITMHPGEYIKLAYIETKQMTQRSLAAKLAVSPATLSRLLDAQSSLTVPMALALERVLGRSAESWLTMQMRYSLSECRKT